MQKKSVWILFTVNQTCKTSLLGDENSEKCWKSSTALCHSLTCCKCCFSSHCATSAWMKVQPHSLHISWLKPPIGYFTLKTDIWTVGNSQVQHVRWTGRQIEQDTERKRERVKLKHVRGGVWGKSGWSEFEVVKMLSKCQNEESSLVELLCIC